MDFTNRHPLHAIDGYENLSMLEMLIPFVDPSLKLPLALFIKFNEIRLIIKCFQSTENLVRLGLHNPSSDPLDMVCALTGMSPDMLKMMFSMMNGDNNSMFSDLFNGNPDMTNMMNMFQHAQANHADSFTDNAPNCNHAFTDNASRSDDFDSNLQQLFAEYDLAQAEQYND